MNDGQSGPPPERSATLAGVSRAQFLKRGIGTALVLTGSASLLEACGSGSGTASTVGSGAAGHPPTRPTGQLAVALVARPASLDPPRADGPWGYTTNQTFYDGLALWDQDPTRLAPGLATSWDVNADATEWTFHLREGVTFHDGEPLTSEAVRKTFEHFRDGPGSFLGSYAGEFEEIDDSDPTTVVIRYKDPFPDLARNSPILGIISAKALAGTQEQASKRLERASAGAGAYRFEGTFAGNKLTASAFERYWGAGPYLESVEFRVVPDESARVAALQAGDVDFIMQVSPRPFTQLQSNRQLASSTQPTWKQQRLIFACDRPPFTDARARQAIAWSVDPAILADKILLGQATVAKGLMPSGCYGYTEPATQYSLDPAKAKQLWDAAGGGDHVVTVGYATQDGATVQQTAEVIVDQIKSAGIQAKAVGLTGTQMGDEFHARTRKYDVILVTFGWINGGPFFYTPGLYSDTQSARYTGKQVLDLQVRQNSTADGPKRLALLKELQGLAQSELWVYALHELKIADAFVADVQGYVTPKDGFMDRFSGTYRA